jgi:hypothetical protein
MSFIWNVILSFDDEELWEDGEDEARETCEALDQINAWFEHGRLVSLIGPTYEDGAGCGMDANLYGGGFKHLDIEASSRSWRPRTGRHGRRFSFGSRGPRKAWVLSLGRLSNSVAVQARPG